MITLNPQRIQKNNVWFLMQLSLIKHQLGIDNWRVVAMIASGNKDQKSQKPGYKFLYRQTSPATGLDYDFLVWELRNDKVRKHNPQG